MQTSAKTKAMELFRTMYAADLVVEDIEKILLEHERDTRYTAIDIIRSMEQHDVEMSGSMFEEQHYYQDCVNTEETINTIHNMKVGCKE